MAREVFLEGRRKRREEKEKTIEDLRSKK